MARRATTYRAARKTVAKQAKVKWRWLPAQWFRDFVRFKFVSYTSPDLVDALNPWTTGKRAA